ncbi:MAG: hypothetical protein ACK2UR_00585 [Candidatus Promineifilaceae bacterium]
MRRLLPLLVLSVLLTAVLAVATRAQDGEEKPLITVRAEDLVWKPGAMIDGTADPQMTLMSTMGTMAFAATEPSDTCLDAPLLALLPEAPADGISFNVENATEADDDPILTCMWGTPPRRQGFRTVWYQLVVPASGRITLDTFSSQYDTVLGVYTGECGDLTAVKCSDDVNGFSSERTFAVSAGETYYIEVADRDPGIGNEKILNFSALLQRLDSAWNAVETKPSPPAISRHSTASLFDMLFVIGGQTGGTGIPIVSNQLLRLNTYTKQWETHLATIPGAGYSNTTAAMVGNQIFIPSGYNGNNLGYDGLHWAYTFDPNNRDDPGYWTSVAAVPKVRGKNFAWAASAAQPGGNSYYLMGGTSSTDLFDTATVSNKEAFVYLVEQDTWLPVSSMQTARYAHTGAWLSANNLGACVAGGLGVLDTGEFVFHTSAECFTPTRGWRFIGDMNIPRIGAGSAVGPDGRWYVFGGLTPLNETTLIAVLQTEVYNPYLNTWSILSPEFNLGGQVLPSARAFVSGSVVGSSLYVTGGSVSYDSNGNWFSDENALPLTEEFFLPSNTSYMPVQAGNFDDYLRPDDNFDEARALGFGQAQSRNFSNQRDFYDFYYFDLAAPTSIRINLEVPDDNDFDLLLYGQNKTLRGESITPFNGDDESIPGINNQFLRLEPRRYYVVVQRAFPAGQPDKSAYYKIELLNQ